jgi:hypothetical protein
MSATDKASDNLINAIPKASNIKRIRVVEGKCFDMAKVSDCVNHILFAEMEVCGITGKAYTLITSYLENRYQTVRFKIRFPIAA